MNEIHFRLTKMVRCSTDAARLCVDFLVVIRITANAVQATSAWPQQENSGVVVLSLSWHNSPAAHGMVCRQVLAAARNTQRVVLCAAACVGVCSSRRGSASMKK